MAAVTAPQQSRIPFPPVPPAPGPPVQATIINVDLSTSSGGSETSVDTGPLDVPAAAELVEEVKSLNTVTLHQSLPDSPGSPTYITAWSLLATTSTSSVTTTSLTAVTVSDPGLLASLLQQAGFLFY